MSVWSHRSLPAHVRLVVTGEENTGLPPFNCKQINLAVTKHTMLYHHHQPKDPGKNKTLDKVQMIAEHRLMMMWWCWHMMTAPYLITTWVTIKLRPAHLIWYWVIYCNSPNTEDHTSDITHTYNYNSSPCAHCPTFHLPPSTRRFWRFTRNIEVWISIEISQPFNWEMKSDIV